MNNEPLSLQVRVYEEIRNPATRLQAAICGLIDGINHYDKNRVSKWESIVALRNLANAMEANDDGE